MRRLGQGDHSCVFARQHVAEQLRIALGRLGVNWHDVLGAHRLGKPPEILAAKRRDGDTARMVAGFCWPWSDPEADGMLANDVVIGEWERPWNRKEKGSPPPHRHPYTIWAVQEEGFDQVGCIYSAQGFEFDYCGVIFGNDLVWDAEAKRWEAEKQRSYDSVVKRSKNLARHLCNTYRVLLSRGMKGTHVCFLDPGTRERFKQLLG